MDVPLNENNFSNESLILTIPIRRPLQHKIWMSACNRRNYLWEPDDREIFDQIETISTSLKATTPSEHEELSPQLGNRKTDFLLYSGKGTSFFLKIPPPRQFSSSF